MKHASPRDILRTALLGLVIACAAPAAVGAAPGGADRPARAAGQAAAPVEARIDAFRERLEQLADEFDLTEQQRDEIRAIAEAAVVQVPPVAWAMAANHRALVELASGGDPDPGEAAAIAADQGEAFADLAAIRVDAFVAIREVLTDEQLGMLAELRALVRSSAGDFIERSAPRRDRRAALRGRDDRLAAVADELDVTPEQRAEIRAIVESAVPGALDIAADMAANRQAISEAIAQPAGDPAGIDALVEAQGDLFGELVLVGFDVRVEVRQVLTAEQLALLDELRASMRNRLAEFLGSF